MNDTRFWRYEVDEVEGDNMPVKVGDIIVDRWKQDRTWRLHNLRTMKPLGYWHGKLLGEVTDPDKLAQLRERHPRVSV